MLPRNKTVPLKSEFSRIRGTGKMYDSPLFGLVINYGQRSDSATAAFVVSKKIDKSAVVRHNVKRKFADAIMGFLPRLAKNIEIVFLAKGGAVAASREEITQELESILLRAKLI